MLVSLVGQGHLHNPGVLGRGFSPYEALLLEHFRLGRDERRINMQLFRHNVDRHAIVLVDFGERHQKHPLRTAEIDQDDGVPVNVVSKKLHVDSSFDTTQSKMLEKKGFIRRKTSTEDARIVQMSLTDKAYKHLANLASQQEALNQFIFAEFDDRELAELTDRLAALQNRFEKACLKVVP